MPPPNTLKAFDAIVKDGAERIFSLTEEESRHRREIEQKQLTAEIATVQKEQSLVNIGMIFGWSLSLGAVVAAVIAVWLDAHWSAPVALVGVPIMSAVRAIILRK